MTRRVLIVSPHFPPVNAPDMQRVRLALPFLRKHGWEPTVLALTPESVEGAVVEPLLVDTYPADIQVVRVQGWSPRLTRWAGIGNLWWRCGRALTEAGDHLLREQNFDLVFISTTQFDAFQLGPRWLRRHGVPYVLDYQDPWTNPYYARSGARPPGGRLKFALSQWHARRIEPTALREAAAIIAVSDAYGAQLADSYPWFDTARVQVLPFGASPADFAVAAAHPPARPLVDFDDGCFHYIYTGRCGPDMALALRILFRGFRRYLDTAPNEARRIRFHFIGTDYAPPPLGREWALPIAHDEGVPNFVQEHCARVPYFEALYYLSRADTLVAVGSDDPTYSASKIYPYILARRPLLMIYHKRSLVLDCAARVGVGLPIAFEAGSDIDDLARRVHLNWFNQWANHSSVEPADSAFAPFSAPTLAQQLTECFGRAAISPYQTRS